MGKKDAKRLEFSPPVYTIGVNMYEKISGFDPPLFKEPLEQYAFGYNKKKRVNEIIKNEAPAASVQKRFLTYEKAFMASKDEQQKLIAEIKKKEEDERKNKEAKSNPATPAPAKDEDKQKKEEPAVVANEQILKVSGQITEVGEGLPGVIIRLMADNSGTKISVNQKVTKVFANKNGNYTLKLKTGKVYRIVFTKRGHFSKSYYFTVKKGQYFFTKPYDFYLYVTTI